MIRIAISDDHEIVRRGMRQIVAEDPAIQVVGEAGDYDELMGLLAARPCDVLLLDIVMPGKNGIEILKVLRQRHPGVRVLVLSMHPEEHYAVRAVRAGAAGYVSKSSATENLLAAIRQIAAGRRYITPEVAEILAAQYATPGSRPAHENLSDREFQTLRLFASGKRLSEAAEELSLSPKTVSVYRARLLEKLRLRSNADLARYAVEHKLLD